MFDASIICGESDEETNVYATWETAHGQGHSNPAILPSQASTGSRFIDQSSVEANLRPKAIAATPVARTSIDPAHPLSAPTQTAASDIALRQVSYRELTRKISIESEKQV